MNAFRKIVCHLQIVLAGMLLVLVIIDRFNSAMAFIDNDITKALLFVLCLLAIINSALLASLYRRRDRRQAQTLSENRAPQYKSRL
ncbi:MAG: hypothetical protein Q4B42_04900 [Oscillospiraceae bacterium]|nr:hypothetical protein [Oscillospiraceae bacterium]